MFCKTVWNGLHILPDGYIRLCSIGTNSKLELDLQRARDKNGNVMHILTHSIEEIMNSDKHCEVRQFNVDNPDKFSPHCDCCETRELITNFDKNHPNKSRRTYLMKIDTESIVDESNFSTKLLPGGKVDWMPSSLDIRFGNLCNQKCIMCGPTFSNQWYDEWVDYYDTTKFGQGQKVQIVKDPVTSKWLKPVELTWFENPIWWEKFEQFAPYLTHIYITGGEPMVTPAHDEMLDILIERGYAKNIWLEYDSNCSAINNKIVERWSHFKNVDLRASMDAIDQQYELIRYGGEWNKFVENIKRLKQLESDSNGKIRLVCASTCFQISTVFSIIESEEWCNEVGVDFHMRFLEGPDHHAVSSLSTEQKTILLNYYIENKHKSSKAEMIISYLKNSIATTVGLPDKIDEFFKFMDYLDKSRGTDWKAIFPRVLQLLKVGNP